MTHATLNSGSGGPSIPPQPPFQRFPKRPSPHYTSVLVPCLSGFAGLMLGAAMPALIGADSLLDYAKCALFGVAGGFVSYGVNRLAIEKGTYQAAIGTPGAMSASLGAIGIVGVALATSTYAGLALNETERLNLEEFGEHSAIAITQTIEEVQAAGRIEPVVRCCQTNSNQSLVGQWLCPLSHAETAPLGKSGGAVQLEEVSAREAALLVEVVRDGSVDGSKLLQTSHAPEPKHCSFPSSERQVRVLGPVVHPPACFLQILGTKIPQCRAVGAQLVGDKSLAPAVLAHCFL